LNKKVVIIRTGTANLASVMAGFARLEATTELSVDPRTVEQAEYLVLPGVGAFGAAMAELRAHGLVDPLVRRFKAGRPSLAVCLGMQLLARQSEETPGESGLGVIDAHITRFPDSVRVPQFGWNMLEPQAAEHNSYLTEKGYVYFANSFRLSEPPAGWRVALTDYAGPFVAAMERGGVLACQFHPELSGAFGLELLGRWLMRSDDAAQEVAAC